MDSTPRAALAELIGTWVFFTIGAGSVVISHISRQEIALLGVAFAHGVTLAIMVTIFGRVSGGHFNPAVTIGVWVGGKIETMQAFVYVAAQLLGGVLAGFTLRSFFTRVQWEPVNLGTPSIGGGMTVGKAILVEAVLTFFLLLAVWGTAIDPRGPKVAGFAIGLMVFCDILLGGKLTGAAMNPARAFGPAVAAGFWENHWVYWVGPVAGGAIASLVYRAAFYAEERPAAVQTAIAPEPPAEPAEPAAPPAPPAPSAPPP